MGEIRDREETLFAGNLKAQSSVLGSTLGD